MAGIPWGCRRGRGTPLAVVGVAVAAADRTGAAARTPSTASRRSGRWRSLHEHSITHCFVERHAKPAANNLDLPPCERLVFRPCHNGVGGLARRRVHSTIAPTRSLDSFLSFQTRFVRSFAFQFHISGAQTAAKLTVVKIEPLHVAIVERPHHSLERV